MSDAEATHGRSSNTDGSRMLTNERTCACGTRLARDNRNTRCRSCQRKTFDYRISPPVVSFEFWLTDDMRAALETRHMGTVLRAFRTHPCHRISISQETAGSWLGLSQEQVCRFERKKGPASERLDTLIRFARTLRIPQQFLWFDLPDSSRQSIARSGDSPSLTPERETADSARCYGSPRQPSPWPDGDVDDIQAIRTTAKRLIALDNQFGGTDVAPLAARACGQALRMVKSDKFRGNQEREAYAAAAEIAEVAGWILFDAEKQEEARKINQEALFLARLSGDRETELLILLNMSLQAAHVGHWRESFLIAESVLSTERLMPRVRAMFLVRQARALAQSGQRHDALRAFQHAEALFSDGVSHRDPSWAWWIDQPELDGQHGAALAELGEWDESITFLRRAVDVPNAPNYRVGFATRLLAAQVNARSWRDAETIIEDMAERVEDIGSARALTRLGRVTTAILPRPDTPRSLRDAAEHLNAVLVEQPTRYVGSRSRP